MDQGGWKRPQGRPYGKLRMKRDQRRTIGLTDPPVALVDIIPHFRHGSRTFYSTSLVWWKVARSWHYFGRSSLTASYSMHASDTMWASGQSCEERLDKTQKTCHALLTHQRAARTDNSHRRRFAATALHSLSPINPLLSPVLQLHSTPRSSLF